MKKFYNFFIFTFKVKVRVNMESPFRVWIAPISGSEFPNQLALVSEVEQALSKVNPSSEGSESYSPDLFMGASGGNISGYLALAGDWNYEGIVKACRSIDQSIFIRSWFPGPLKNIIPVFIPAVLQGSLYRAGTGSAEIFQTFFTKETITRCEILTLTFNQTKMSPQIFSNRTEEGSFFKSTYFNQIDSICYDVDSITYNDGDIIKISEATVASYSIPLVTQPQEIGGETHADGGINYASPFTPVFKKIVQNIYPSLIAQNRKLQTIYFCSYDMNDPNIDRTSFYGNSTIAKSLAQMLQSSILQDRANVLNLLELCGLRLTFRQGNKINTPELTILLDEIKNKNYSLILYPTGAPHINLFNFTSQDVIDTINISRKNYNFYLWVEE